jgi:hypothetical protein
MPPPEKDNRSIPTGLPRIRSRDPLLDDAAAIIRINDALRCIPDGLA